MRRRSGKSDEQLEQEAADLAGELAAFKREHLPRSRDAIHAAVDERLDETRAQVLERLDRLAGDIRGLPISTPPGGGVSLVEVAALWALTENPTFREAVHAAIARAPSYSPLTGKQIDTKVRQLEKEIDARVGELKRRGAERKVAEARAELEQAEAALAGNAPRGGAG